MNEQRNELRMPATAAARIMFNGGGYECVARDISLTGARLQVTIPTAIIPDQIEFLLKNDGITHPARVVWKLTSQIGIKFADSTG